MYLLRDGWEVTLAIRLIAPVSDRQTGASGGIYRVASKLANRGLADVARKSRPAMRESLVTIWPLKRDRSLYT